ncbi:MAG: hypothetical protein K0U34_03040 [Alphaproteobacteria bacterium]|nr:hypothetical protein [Alphaproteobacteria bacterium]
MDGKLIWTRAYQARIGEMAETGASYAGCVIQAEAPMDGCGLPGANLRQPAMSVWIKRAAVDLHR